ncbi:5'/3'-nucleotidase SurE [Psychroserpens sp. NJDZ02]|uniref:5'/3'-nucleotidase SurE n=1 Tax=Psychroserpens sp. NJDZ02 TaxID=2570561 RepID=UPI0010A82324|nr:5'/3'-nucleotidase SurE [Psychroserpens sp. NJDZ02]QCE40698.1 5'/3'-nucleotidase SurE [Psychroserpens sp. NJDZ02]
MSKKPLILVTNDDGITAPGILTLIKVMETLGDVVVVAPDSPQSGMGHAITLNNVLHLDKVSKKGDKTVQYSCSGTPADCVKIAVNQVLDRRPDLCVSGINHGSNSSINVIYSGTMSAAIEAGIEGIPAIGFSLLNYSWDADFEASEKYIKQIAENALTNGIAEGIILNVNIPDLKEKDLKGIKICRQAKANWKEKFDKRKTPQGRDYYWLTGEFVNYDKGTDTDEFALEQGYISVVPVQYDLTAHHYMQQLNTWSFEQ